MVGGYNKKNLQKLCSPSAALYKREKNTKERDKMKKSMILCQERQKQERGVQKCHPAALNDRMEAEGEGGSRWDAAWREPKEGLKN